jgi:putative inorganic carbon (HCO3(-)) transporter
VSSVAHVGGPLACLGLAVLLVARGRELRLAGLAAWAVGVLLLVVYLAPDEHRAVLAAAGVVGALLAGAGGLVLQRAPWLVAFGTVLLAPARIPVTVGSTEAMLLVPLYVVIGAAAARLALDLLRGDGRSRELGAAALPLAAFIAWTGLSLSWDVDLKQGAVQLLFFFCPFGLLALSLARLPWRPWLLPWLGLELAALAVLFSLVGIYQEIARDVFWNPKVIVGNAYQSFFRVNSLFWDPSIYGRFLVVAILAALVVFHWARTAVVRLLLAAGVALAWVGLLFSYSQTSFAALLVGALVVGGVAARTWAYRLAPAAVIVVAGTLLLARPADAPALPLVQPPLADATSGRGKLIREGIQIAVHHPVEGVGVGGFRRAYADRIGLAGPSPRVASHTTPVTVAAETGVVGLLLLAWLALAALQVFFRRPGPSLRSQASLVLGLALLAIGVHSLGYNALFEDPLAWAALGLGVLVARAPEEDLA